MKKYLMKCLCLMAVACLFGCTAMPPREEIVSTIKKLLVPEQYSSPAKAVVAAGGMNEARVEIFVKAGVYEGEIAVVGNQFKGKHIVIVGVNKEEIGKKSAQGVFRHRPVFSSDTRNTIRIEAPGDVKISIRNCVIVNTAKYGVEEPRLRWSQATILAAWGCSIDLRDNTIISQHGHAISESYVDEETIIGNLIMAPRIAMAHFCNNFGRRQIKNNQVWGAKVAHYFDGPIERGPDIERYFGVTESVLFPKMFETGDLNAEVKEEFKDELLRH